MESDLKHLATNRGAAASATQTNYASPAALYLDLLKRSVLNEIYLDDELRILYLRACVLGSDVFDPAVLHDIRDRRRLDYQKLSAGRRMGRFIDNKIYNSGFNHTMMGRARLDSLHACLDTLRQEEIPGNLVECGVWRGGGCIFMAGYLEAHRLVGKRVIVVDSFEGLPPPSLPQDAGLDLSKDKFPELAVSLGVVQENFTVYGLQGPKVSYLKGWFKDTLPNASIGPIALLRMDGDLYQSTMDILINLYDMVAPGGFVIVDDFGAIAACQQAVLDFFRMRGLPVPQMQEIDWTGVWFRKES